MAWPFASAAAPNFDTGFVVVAQDVATVPPTAGLGTQYWLMGGNFSNGSDSDEYLTILDGSGAIVEAAVRIPAHDSKPLEWPFMPIVGLQWFATGPLTGKLWGYA